MRHVGVGLVDVEVLGEHAILDVGEFPSAQRAAGLRGVSGLRGGVAPLGRNRADQDVIARLEALDRGADLMDDADRLVAQGEIVARPDCAIDRVHVGGADEGLGGLDDGVGRAGSGNRFIGESDLANPFHHEGSHRG